MKSRIIPLMHGWLVQSINLIHWMPYDFDGFSTTWVKSNMKLPKSISNQPIETGFDYSKRTEHEIHLMGKTNTSSAECDDDKFSRVTAVFRYVEWQMLGWIPARPRRDKPWLEIACKVHAPIRLLENWRGLAWKKKNSQAVTASST